MLKVVFGDSTLSQKIDLSSLFYCPRHQPPKSVIIRYEIQSDMDVEDVLLHLMENSTDYLGNKSLMLKMVQYLAEKRAGLKQTKTFTPGQDAAAARILAEAMSNQRV